MRSHHIVARALLAMLFSVCSVSCGQDRASTPAMLPPPSPLKIHQLSVVFVENRNLPNLEDAEVKEILDVAAAKALESLKLKVEFSYAGREPIASFFAGLPNGMRERIKRDIFDFKGGAGDRALMVKNTAESLRLSGDDSVSARAYAGPYLVSPPKDDSLMAFSEALVETQLGILHSWRALKGNDGKAVIDESPYNEYLYWLAISAQLAKHEVVITNQIIASAEYMNNAIHSAVRGGVSNGYTNPASRTKSGLTSVVSVYPFLADDEITRRLRDGSFGSIRERNEVIAMLLVHELGHQLLGLGHPFENTACVMNPPRLLHFKDWLKMQNPKECEIGSSSDMKIGRFTFLDLRKRESQ